MYLASNGLSQGGQQLQSDWAYWGDPWDVSRYRRGRAQSVRLRRPHALMVATFLVTLFALLLLSNGARAQSTPPPSEDIGASPKQASLKLDQHAKDLASDYIALLEQLRFLTEDYQVYFATLDEGRARANARALHVIATKLRDTSYFGNHARIRSEIALLRDEFRAQGDTLMALSITISDKRSDVTNESVSPKLYRLTRSLSRELETLNDVLEEDLAEQLRQNLEMTQLVQEYVKQVVLVTWLDKFPSEEEVPQEPALPSYEQEEFDYEWDEPHEPPVPEVPALPPAPRVPRIDFGSREIEFKGESGETRVLKESMDSIVVSSAAARIYVVNPIGVLDIVSWKRGWISAHFEVEVAAGSRSEAEELIGWTDVRLYNKGDAIYVESAVPELSNPRTRIISSTLKIKAPAGNSLICSNSFGTVSVRGFANEVQLSSDHSKVLLSDIKGRVRATNNMGRMEIKNVVGPLDVRNAYEPLVLSGCEGQMEIENAFSTINMTNSGGDVAIRNSGSVTVSGFSGTLEIENSNGPLVVKDMEGDLLAQNSLNNVSIRNIRGTVTVANAQGVITVEDIHGPLTATNTFGAITGRSLGGPIHLINRNGPIDLFLNRNLSGASSVSADFGSIELRLGKKPDLLLTVETIGGSIRSTFPLSVEEAGATRLAQLELGKARNSLAITGTNTDILIRRSE